MRRHFLAIAAAMAIPMSARAGDVSFSARPEVRKTDGGWRIALAVSAPTDVEVAVLDEAGRVVRHVAAGALGGRAAPPPPLRPGLRQELLWDGTDDDGKPAAGGPFRVRVRAGMRAKLGRVIGEPGRTAGKIYGLATDAKGNLYVASGCVYPSAPIFSIKVFDRAGKYLRTILPMPAALKLSQAAEYGGARRENGHLVPGNHHPLVPYVQQGGIVAFLGSTVRDGVLWLLNTDGRICRIRTDGSAVQWASAPQTMRPSGGPMCWAVGPGGTRLYMTGWWNQRATQSKGKVGPRDGIVYEVDPATGRTRELLAIDVPKDSYWLSEVNGWYHYRNWGRKNGCAALHGMAADARGRLVVCDRVHQRLAVYDRGGKLLGRTKIDWEDRGDKLVVTGALNERLPPADGIVKVWADPDRDDVYVNNGWSGLSRYDGLTGRGGPISIRAIDLAVGPDGLLYLYGRKGWNEPIYRCDRNFKPVPFAATGKPTTTKSSAGREVYGRYGMGWSNKGIAIGRDGRIYVRSMYAWCKYFVAVFRPDGTAETHDRVSGGILGPLDAGSGGIQVDRQGFLYVGTHGLPKGMPQGSKRSGCIVKVSPQGGGIARRKGDRPGIQFADYFFEGAVTAYPRLSPRADRGCVCKEGRFDLDDYARLYVPDVLDFCIRVYDNAGNLICRFGRYGNADSAGLQSPLPRPAIPFGWPMSVSVNRAGRLYVADVLNQRIVRVDLAYAAEATAPVGS